MTSFANLMAISASQTRETQQAVELALQERKRKEALQRKQQEEREAKEREREKQIRLKRFEEERRQKERQEKLEAERKARESAAQRKEDEQRDLLRYGPKRASKLGGSSANSLSGSKDPRKSRRPDDEDEDDESGGVVLTREELRQKKQQAEMRKLFSSKRTSHQTTSYKRVGQRLPGGAVNIVIDPRNSDGVSSQSQGGGSVKDRLSQMPNMLTKLNTEKKDKRMVDEIYMAIKEKKGKVLEGESAAAFDDWFGTKKKEAARKSPPATSAPVSAPSTTPVESRPSKFNSPAPSGSFTSSAYKGAPNVSRPSSTKPLPTHRPAASTSRGSSADIYPTSSQKLPKISKVGSSSTSVPASSSQRRNPATSSASHLHRESKDYRERDRDAKEYYRDRERPSKRPRSPSLSDSPPPPSSKKRALKEDISSEIWSLFGKDRNQYTARDVFSDDEDMEADARALEREEKYSARIAKREEELALEEERQHEEEKRRRKKERDRLAR